MTDAKIDIWGNDRQDFVDEVSGALKKAMHDQGSIINTPDSRRSAASTVWSQVWSRFRRERESGLRERLTHLIRDRAIPEGIEKPRMGDLRLEKVLWSGEGRRLAGRLLWDLCQSVEPEAGLIGTGRRQVETASLVAHTASLESKVDMVVGVVDRESEDETPDLPWKGEPVVYGPSTDNQTAILVRLSHHPDDYINDTLTLRELGFEVRHAVSLISTFEETPNPMKEIGLESHSVFSLEDVLER